GIHSAPARSECLHDEPGPRLEGESGSPISSSDSSCFGKAAGPYRGGHGSSAIGPRHLPSAYAMTPLVSAPAQSAQNQAQLSAFSTALIHPIFSGFIPCHS